MHSSDAFIPQYGELVTTAFGFRPNAKRFRHWLPKPNARRHWRGARKTLQSNIIVAGRKSPKSLYDPKLATMEASGTSTYDQSDATGFIRLHALRLKLRAQQKET